MTELPAVETPRPAVRLPGWASTGLAGALGLAAFAAGLLKAEDGIRGLTVTGVQTCALPISGSFGQKSVPDGRVWRRIVPKVMAHPIIVLVPTLGLVLALGAPFLRIQTASAFVGILPMKTDRKSVV